MTGRVIDLEERYTRRFNALEEAMFGIERFELFTEGLGEFFVSTQQLTEVKGVVAENNADTPVIPLAEIVDEAARTMLHGIVNLYARQVAFNAVVALRNVDEEMRQMEKGRNGNGKKRRKR